MILNQYHAGASTRGCALAIPDDSPNGHRFWGRQMLRAYRQARRGLDAPTARMIVWNACWIGAITATTFVSHDRSFTHRS